jgi:uncharacterized membrane protein required for colicin V production
VLLAVFIIAGEYANFNNDPWWQKSTLIPYGEVVADWIRVMAPKGVDILLPGDAPDETTAWRSGAG